ncbi:unnamed protein product [Paramecium primaurelia]|uniref:non-specific serine/threonine protein kinase n=1 Tax=Paramecium primaurelia TaxID=5886 RepID=A0A8S1KCX9_PARPR|nr:unnamed protein product [Paramecium primaurelia]
MKSSYASLKDLLPLMQNKHSKIKIKLQASQNYEESCTCNQMSCLICSRKRSSSMISLKPLKHSVLIEQGKIEKQGIAQLQSLISRKLSKQASNQLLQQTYYGGKQNYELKDSSTNSSTWLLSKSHSRKISLDNYSQKEAIQLKTSQQQISTISRLAFRFIYVIGKGGFGKVWRVEMKQTKKEFALKEMIKAKIISKRSVNSVMNEKFLLEHLRHPFIVNMHFAFQDKENLYLVLDLLRGGDLRFHIGKLKRFTEDQAKFFACCMLLALQYLHSNGIIHRDLKPENLVFDKDGFLHLTDLGVARLDKDSIANDTSGTPGYMAPEVMCRMEHSYPVDYYALGVILYEILIGKRPYNGKNRQEIREQILAKQVSIKEGTSNISSKAIDFINRLLIRKPQQRLGFGGIEEIIHHSWLKGVQWAKLLNKEMKSLYIPGSIDGNSDFQNQISADSEIEEDCQSLLRRKSVQSLFDGYKFQ